MIDRYVIIDAKVRDEFEKQYQIPYGYGWTKIYEGNKGRIEAFEDYKKFPNDGNLVIEKIGSDFSREVIHPR